MTTEEMKAELEAAEWRFVISDTGHYFIQVIMPNGFDSIYNTDFETTPEQCLSNAVGDAYVHLQEKRELERLRNENAQLSEFIKQVADARVPSEWYTPAPYKYAFHRLKNNAKALITKMGNSLGNN